MTIYRKNYLNKMKKDLIKYLKNVRKISPKKLPLNNRQWCSFPLAVLDTKTTILDESSLVVEKDEDWTDYVYIFRATMMVVIGICAMACGEPCVNFFLDILAWMPSLVVAQIDYTAVFVRDSAATFLLSALLSSIVSRQHVKTLEKDCPRKVPLATLVTPQLVSTFATPQAKLVALHSIQRPYATPMLATSTLLEYRRRRDLPLLHAKILVGPIHAILFDGTIVQGGQVENHCDSGQLRDSMQREVEDSDALLAFDINSVNGMQTFLSAITASALWSSTPSLRKFCQMF
ncbi:hypothetical protein AC1031_006465 [Aphanomyces cochlioides]|nr:hypothetical protein AC1031_006465 [Aphanomyces cochlioides]